MEAGTDKLVMDNQPDIVLVDRQQKKAVVIQSDNKIRKNKHEKIKKCQELKEEKM